MHQMIELEQESFKGPELTHNFVLHGLNNLIQI
jgi:hypothetical protein